MWLKEEHRPNEIFGPLPRYRKEQPNKGVNHPALVKDRLCCLNLWVETLTNDPWKHELNYYFNVHRVASNYHDFIHPTYIINDRSVSHIKMILVLVL